MTREYGSNRGVRRARWYCGVALGLILSVLPSALGARGREGDPFKGSLFDAELVMSHQQAIGLSSEQRDGVVEALQRMQSAIVPWQLSLAASAERLLTMLRQSRVDAEGALAEVQEVLQLENRVKIERVRFLIEIKNLLTAEQQRQLEGIRASS